MMMDEMPGFLIATAGALRGPEDASMGFNPGPLIRHHYEKTWIDA